RQTAGQANDISAVVAENDEVGEGHAAGGRHVAQGDAVVTDGQAVAGPRADDDGLVAVPTGGIEEQCLPGRVGDAGVEPAVGLDRQVHRHDVHAGADRGTGQAVDARRQHDNGISGEGKAVRDGSATDAADRLVNDPVAVPVELVGEHGTGGSPAVG